MAVRPTPPGVGISLPPPASAPPLSPKAAGGSAKNGLFLSSTRENFPLPIAASSAPISPTKRPLPKVPLNVHIPPIETGLYVAVEDQEAGNLGSPTFPPPLPSPTSLSSPRTNEPGVLRTPRGGIAKGPSEALAQRAQMVSATLTKGTLRSNSSTGGDNLRSMPSPLGPPEELFEETKRRNDERKGTEKEAKSREKASKKQKDDEKSRKEDAKRRSASSSTSAMLASLTPSGSDSSIPTKAGKVPLSRGGSISNFSEDDPSLLSSNLSSPQSSWGSSSPLAASSNPETPKRTVNAKSRKPKQYVQENASNYGQLIDLLMRNSFQLMRALEGSVKRSDLDRISKDFIAFFSWREITLDYIKSAIRQDVDHAESEGTLFRTNTLLTAVISSYCQRVGKHYLQTVLGPSFQWLQESKLQFEIDPDQVDNAEVIKQNIFNMNYLANKFFKAVLNNNDTIPFEIREIANTLQTAVLKCFPNSKYSAIGGFFFLRFVCPAVLAPEMFDMSLPEDRSTELRRPLVLVAKILQQIANDQKFNEPHMEPLNDLISKWTVKVHQFFDLLVQKDHAALHKERDRVLEQMKDPEELEKLLIEKIPLSSIITVHKVVSDNIQDLVIKFSDKQRELGYNPAQELADLLCEMGPVPDLSASGNNKAKSISLSGKK